MFAWFVCNKSKIVRGRKLDTTGTLAKKCVCSQTSTAVLRIKDDFELPTQKILGGFLFQNVGLSYFAGEIAGLLYDDSTYTVYLCYDVATVEKQRL